MNYQRVHDEIIDNAQSRQKPDCYCEKHHILPRSMGGSNAKSNIVVLTAREHFLIHWLLWKIFDNHKMACAFQRMTHNKKNGKRYTSKSFQYAREAFRISHAKRMSLAENRKKISDKLKGISKGAIEHDFYHAEHGHVKTTIGLLFSKYGHNRNIAGLVSGRVRSTKGWTLIVNKDDVGYRSGNTHHNIDKNTYNFFHKDHGIEICLRHELIKKYSLPYKQIGQLVRHEKPSVWGWKIVKENLK